MNRSSLIAAFFCWALLAVVSLGNLANAQDFPNLPPLTPADLKVIGTPANSVAPAIILYYAVDADNTKSTETVSSRIKILSEEGRKYADIEIPYVEKYSEIEDLRARTISPDGQVTPFTGQVFDRDIVRSRKFRFHARVFTLSNAHVGSIIEYTYRLHYRQKIPDAIQHPDKYVFDRPVTFPATNWTIQRELFLKHGRFTLAPVKGAIIRQFALGFGKPVTAVILSDRRMQFDFDDIPAFEEEDYSPPDSFLKSSLALYYAVEYSQSDRYWLGLAKSRSEDYDAFIGNSKVVLAEVGRLTSPTDSPETKIRKLYARTQLIRGLGYEDDKTDKQRKQENLKENKSIEEVLTRGYAYGHDANLLFIGLVRAAGFQASPVQVVSRRNALFLVDYPNSDQLDAMLVVVRFNGNLVFLDPESKFCPYGLLPWEETDAGGIIIDYLHSHVGSTPVSSSAAAVTKTTADLILTPEGNLKGSISIAYSGQEALIHRQWAANVDDLRRHDELETSLRNSLPQGAQVKLVKVDGWEKSEEPLTAQFDLEIPNYALPAGRRFILPLGVLHTSEKLLFPSPRRIHPVYFDYPFETYEDIRIQLPAELEPEALPPDKKVDAGSVSYSFSVARDSTSLKISRFRKTAGVWYPVEQYPALRAFYASVLAGDSQQATLKTIGGAAPQ
jgi:hypothetical protein